MRITLKKARRALEQSDIECAGLPAKVPDFLGRLRAIYGAKQLALSGAELMAKDRTAIIEDPPGQ